MAYADYPPTHQEICEAAIAVHIDNRRKVEKLRLDLANAQVVLQDSTLTLLELIHPTTGQDEQFTTIVNNYIIRTTRSRSGGFTINFKDKNER